MSFSNISLLLIGAILFATLVSCQECQRFKAGKYNCALDPLDNSGKIDFHMYFDDDDASNFYVDLPGCSIVGNVAVGFYTIDSDSQISFDILSSCSEPIFYNNDDIDVLTDGNISSKCDSFSGFMLSKSYVTEQGQLSCKYSSSERPDFEGGNTQQSDGVVL